MSFGLTRQDADSNVQNAKIRETLSASRIVANGVYSHIADADNMGAVNLVAENGVFDQLTATNPIFPSLQYNVNVKYYGAKGDGVTDDTVAIQTAIDYARANNITLYFPSGQYIITSALDFTQWTGFSIMGSDQGTINSPPNTNLIAKGVTQSAAFDFSGSNSGRINGIAFTNSSSSPGSFKALVLFARLAGSVPVNYGSENTLQNCVFSLYAPPSGGVAIAYCYQSEVQRFENCRFNTGGIPCIIFTGTNSPYNVSSPFGLTFNAVTGITYLTVDKCEFNGNNADYIIIDSSGFSGENIYIRDSYSLITGNNTHLLRVVGGWNYVSVTDVRLEGASLGSVYGAILLSGSLNNFRLEIDDTTGGSLVSGSGDLNGGVIEGYTAIRTTGGALTGNITAVVFVTAGSFSLALTGNVGRCRVIAPSLGTLAVTGTLELDDGNGGYIVYARFLDSGSQTYTFPTTLPAFSGLYTAQYSGNVAAVWTSYIGSTRYSVTTTAATSNPQSTLAIVGSGTNLTAFTATFGGTGDLFTVRRSAAPALT